MTGHQVKSGRVDDDRPETQDVGLIVPDIARITDPFFDDPELAGRRFGLLPRAWVAGDDHRIATGDGAHEALGPREIGDRSDPGLL